MGEAFAALRYRRALFADDLDFVQRGTALLMVEAGLIVQVCESGAALRRRLAEQAHGFDVVVVGLLNMGKDFEPERHVPELAQQYPQLPFVIFSSEDMDAAHYLDQGVRGYVSKMDGVRGLLTVLNAVLHGDYPRCSESVSVESRLARREREVLKLVADGFSSKQIAPQLGISEHTVKEYYARINAKLDATGLAHAVAIAVRARLIR